MGLIYTDVTIQSLHGKAGSIDSPFLVDNGAVDCLMSAERLREVGIEPESSDVYELADGRVLELPVGWARLGFMARSRSPKWCSARKDSSQFWA